MTLRVYEEPPQAGQSEWLRPQGAASYLGWSERHLRYVRKVAVEQRYGDPAHRVGVRAITFRKDELDALALWWERHLLATGQGE
jgi:hypothetical protein